MDFDQVVDEVDYVRNQSADGFQRYWTGLGRTAEAAQSCEPDAERQPRENVWAVPFHKRLSTKVSKPNGRPDRALICQFSDLGLRQLVRDRAQGDVVQVVLLN